MVRPLVSLALASACRAPVALPAETGPYPVGETLLHLEDRDRDEPMTPSADDVREVPVRLWYPAAAAGEPADYVPDLRDLRGALDGKTQRLFRHVEVSATLDAPVADEAERLPLVVLSAGNDRIGAEYAFLAQELASHGFAVAALDHPYDVRAAALADGHAVEFAEDAWPPLPPPPADGVPDADTAYLRFYEARALVRAADASFVVDRFAADDPLGGRIDVARVGFVGHSVGGVAAGTFCATDPRAAGCVNLDGDSGLGPYFPSASGGAFEPPYLMLTKSFRVSDGQLRDWGLTRDAWAANLAAQRDAAFGAVAGGSWRVELAGASHESFTDEPFVLAALQGGAPAPHQHRMDEIRAWTLAFLDRFLRDGEGALLDESPGDGVTVERW